MANSTTTTSLSFLLLVLLLPSAINATRPAPASIDTNKKLQKECVGEFGGGLPTGAGSAVASGGIPSFTDLDHSGPAAANSRYIPGFDDTFVPNPGYEIPRSSGGSSGGSSAP